jgi:hypothetical protein
MAFPGQPQLELEQHAHSLCHLGRWQPPSATTIRRARIQPKTGPTSFWIMRISFYFYIDSDFTLNSHSFTCSMLHRNEPHVNRYFQFPEHLPANLCTHARPLPAYNSHYCQTLDFRIRAKHSRDVSISFDSNSA